MFSCKEDADGKDRLEKMTREENWGKTVTKN